MKKSLTEQTYQFTVNSYAIRMFNWTQLDQNNVNTIKLTVVYDLGTMDESGTFTPSPIPEHRNNKIELYNIGKHYRLTEFLMESGAVKSDLWDFNYHALQRLVEVDVEATFGLTPKPSAA